MFFSPFSIIADILSYFFVLPLLVLLLLPSRNSTCFFFLMIRRPPRSTLDRSSAASDVYKRQIYDLPGQKDMKISYEVPYNAFCLFNFFFLFRIITCLLYTSPSPRDRTRSRMPSSA